MKLKEYFESLEKSFKDNFDEMYDTYVDDDEVSENRTDVDIINKIIEEYVNDTDEIEYEEDPCILCKDKSDKCNDDWCDELQKHIDEYEELKLECIYNLQKYYNSLTISTVRSRFHLTQQALSNMTGIPKRTIGNWESGQNKPAQYLIKLISFYVENHIN